MLDKYEIRYFGICSVACVVVFIHSLSPSYALNVTLAWDANTEPDLAGYRVYYGTESGDPYEGQGAQEGDSPVDMPLDQDEDPDPSVVQFTLRDLPQGDYFLAVTAYNTAGLESGYSNEASTSSDEPSASYSQNSASNSEGTAGGGGCFVVTAAWKPNTP